MTLHEWYGQVIFSTYIYNKKYKNKLYNTTYFFGFTHNNRLKSIIYRLFSLHNNLDIWLTYSHLR